MSLIRINQKFYEANLNKIASRAGGFNKIICVFKDNAYGHSATLLAPIAKNMGVNFIAVKNEGEANELKAFFDNILILSHIPNSNENSAFIYALNDISKARLFKENTRIHLKIDTAMHRNGVCVQNLEFAYKEILKNKLNLEGIFTHFAGSDEMDASFFIQKNIFEMAKKIIKNLAKKDLLFHSYNSSALFRTNNFPKDELCRVGLTQFGYGDESLQKILSLYAHKLSSRVLEVGQGVGYGGKFVAKESINIATYDLGYADGLFRYNGKGILYLANGKKMLGRMSMDSFSCEDSGDEICVLKDAQIWADFFNTISYEILVKLHPNIKRILV
ncbi:alanine racemase [Campylobacter sp. LR264d]|uniref:alanine racemase n=1 Tax=Campylobacter sp. LR264d TaxID=2593544 RepID=UPI001238E55A|nr:alanine racemase [Campylobacter sp. LR264d]KAA6230049.1 alanine racemase [Campylobacter sp. LR264d]